LRVDFLQRLLHGFRKYYYRDTVTYIAIMVTLIFISILTGWGKT
jgi:thiosulfate reductase cytochrome b subunit